MAPCTVKTITQCGLHQLTISQIGSAMAPHIVALKTPLIPDDKLQLWAPDITQGPDGRYYLYYCFSFYPQISVAVAVADKPEGPFEFYGHVHYPENIKNGADITEYMPFDPAILTDDDGRVYLYYSFCPAEEKEMFLPEISEQELEQIPEDTRELFRLLLNAKFGENSMIVELEQDMLTAKYEPKDLVPGGHHTAGTGFEGHGFFEASSIRSSTALTTSSTPAIRALNCATQRVTDQMRDSYTAAPLFPMEIWA